MTQLASGGTRLKLGSSGRVVFNGALCDFDDANGGMSGHWTDAYDVFGASYHDQSLIEDGRLKSLAQHPIPGFAFSLGHLLIGRDIGVSDNFEVGVEFIDTDNLGQCMPAALMKPDFDAPDQFTLGIAGCYDISIPETYIQNVFQLDENDFVNVHAPDPYYEIVQGTRLNSTANPFPDALNPAGNVPKPTANTCAIRVVGSQCALYWNGIKRGGNGTLFEWADDVDRSERTWAGIQMIPKCFDVGQDLIAYLQDLYGREDVEAADQPDWITKWWWRPISSL